jgi:hydroxymethylpyrimidine pyrophosphatase-like HAD family hydrolase
MPDSTPPAFLFAFDFDGTVVDHDPHPGIHPNFNRFLAHTKSNGGVWAVNTGRTLFQTLEGLAQHRILPLPDFIMAKERELYHLGPYNRYVDLGDWNKRCIKEHKRFHKDHKRVFKKVRAFVEKETQAEWVEGLEETPGVVATSEEELHRVCGFIEDQSAGRDNLSYERNSVYLRFSHAAYNKGSVLQALAQMLALSPDCVCVAGDNHNDLSMLDPDVACYRICPSNAIPEVHERIAAAGGVVGQGRASFGLLDGINRAFGLDFTASM